MTVNLISISSLCDMGYVATFTKDDCFITKNKTIAIIGRRKGCPYQTSIIEKGTTPGKRQK
jgi:hypothetical protein